MSVIESLTAGAIAGAIEATITYPTEFVKTQLQLQTKNSTQLTLPIYKGPIDCAIQTIKTKGVTGLYKGLSALVTGTATKAAIRFLSFVIPSF